MRQHNFALRFALPGAAFVAAVLAGCSSTPLPPIAPPVARAPAPIESAAPGPGTPAGHVSAAASPRAYRQDAAQHLYARNSERIYNGKLPPLLYAIGVLEVEVGSRGEVRSLHWMRAPSHAPEVVAEIERTVRAAAPFPAPARMGHVVYTETWLWHKSGRFQLDTLTEGQL
jgi:periplasmic protein TonB